MVKKINKDENINNDKIKVKKIKDNSKTINNKNYFAIKNNNNELSTNSKIIYNILKYLNIDDIHLCSLVNKEWNKVSNSNKIWELLFLKNIFEIKNFIDENEIYSKGCLKQQFSNDSFTFKELYSICFPHHFERFELTNIFKNFEIISNNDTNKILPNIKNFENKIIKSHKTQSVQDIEKEISNKIMDFIDYCFGVKSSFKMEKIWSKDNVKIFLLSSYKKQVSKNSHLWPIFYNTFEYLVCIANNVESIQDGKKTIKEYSRFIKMRFKIDVAYNASNHFINEDSNYFGQLSPLKIGNYRFLLFDIDNPKFEERDTLFLDYKDKESENNKTISTLELWYERYKHYNNDHSFVSNQFIKGLNEFSRNNIEFGKGEFYRDLFNYNDVHVDFENPNNRHNLAINKQFDNIEWKLKLYLNYRENLSFLIKENENNSILQFIENSTILKFQKSNSIGYYEPFSNTELEFEFSIPYENNILTISLNYRYELAGDTFNVDYDQIYFSIEFKFNEEKFDILYECTTDVSLKEPETFPNFKKELIENIKVDNLLFQDFISILFKNKFPLFEFKFSSLLRLIEFNKFISFTGKYGNQVPELSDFDDIY